MVGGDINGNVPANIRGGNVIEYEIFATRCRILGLKCTKFDSGWGSAPDPAGGANGAPPDPLAGLRGPTSKEKVGTEGEGVRLGREGKGEEVRGEGKGKVVSQC